jgi:hypothetical protein
LSSNGEEEEEEEEEDDDDDDDDEEEEEDDDDGLGVRWLNSESRGHWGTSLRVSACAVSASSSSSRMSCWQK